MRRFWCAIVFCVLTAEYDVTWEKHWLTPWHYLTDIIFSVVPAVHIPWYDVIVLALMFAGRRGAGLRAKPVEKAIWITIGTLVLWALYGALRAGSVLDMRLQLHTIVAMLLTALMQLRVFQTREHYRMLGKTIVYAALFRFAMMFTFYVTVMRSLTVPVETVTDHGDLILFVTAIVIVVANAIHARSRKSTWRAVAVTALMLWCIQINNRRLAYVGLVGAVVIIVSLIWTSQLRRKLLRYLKIVGPIAALYLAIGWSHPTGIFKPLASLQSASDVNNPLTQSRILEDMGLIVTLQTNPLVGVGFGQKYTEISTTYSVSQYFPQYRYVPHNSVLALVAFTGAMGFAGIWMIFPITVYFSARSYTFAKLPIDKTISMVALCEVIIHTNQMWGDIGILAPQGLVVMSGAIAAAARVAVFTGAWPTKKRRLATASEMGVPRSSTD